MEIDELTERLMRFCREMLRDPQATVSNVAKTEGHAGFSYFFEVTSGGQTQRCWLRLPPPGVKIEGTADVLRQACAIKALAGTAVPHAPVLWSGDDPQWFESPYFVTPRLEGDIVRPFVGAWWTELPADTRRWMAEQAMTALAGIHQVEDWRRKTEYLGPPLPLDFDVLRWDRFYEKTAEPELLALFPKVREKLLERMPKEPRLGIYHGDYQWGNLFYGGDGRLLAVIDWELVGIGATLNDLGWILTFSDTRAWAIEGLLATGLLPPPEELQAMYVNAYGSDPGDVAWFQALAAFKFATITGFNLMLHRRGKRDDPTWELVKDSMPTLMAYALECLGG